MPLMLIDYVVIISHWWRLLNSNELDVKHEIAVWRYVARRTSFAIRECGRDDESTHAADFHAGDALGPSTNDLVEPKTNRLAEVVATLENDAVFTERPGIMSGNRGAFRDFGACSLKNICNLERFDAVARDKIL